MRPLLLILCLSGVLPAQDVLAEAHARGKQIVDEAVQALGGNAFLTMADRLESGRAYSFYREQLSGLTQARVYTRYLTPPNPPQPGFIGVRERQVFGKKDDTYVIFDEDGGYDVTYRGAKPITKEAIARWQESLLHNVFYTFRMRLNEPGLEFQARGRDMHENFPVLVVDIIDSTNRSTTVYFQESTKLPVKQSWERRDPVTRDRIEEVTVWDKYREVGGIKWPFVVRRERNGERIFEMYADGLQINQSFPDNLFMLPSETKVLGATK